MRNLIEKIKVYWRTRNFSLHNIKKAYARIGKKSCSYEMITLDGKYCCPIAALYLASDKATETGKMYDVATEYGTHILGAQFQSGFISGFDSYKTVEIKGLSLA